MIETSVIMATYKEEQSFLKQSIESILNQSNYKRILITFGMQHKYWFERELKKKQEIQFQSIVNYCE